jgi:hypothetical protein
MDVVQLAQLSKDILVLEEDGIVKMFALRHVVMSGSKKLTLTK